MNQDRWHSGHVGELILFTFAIIALIAYLIALMAGKADQTLGAVVMAASGALGAFMQKKAPAPPQMTAKTGDQSIEVNQPEETP